jgi:hypothetical protein
MENTETPTPAATPQPSAGPGVSHEKGTEPGRDYPYPYPTDPASKPDRESGQPATPA